MVQLNYQYTDNVIIGNRACTLVFDIYVPELALAIEYNGEYHYTSISMYPKDVVTIVLVIRNYHSQTVHLSYVSRYDEVESVKRRDKYKQQHCQNQGITLIVVPYWWDKKVESVVKTIHLARPDIQFPPELMNGTRISMQVPKQLRQLKCA